MPAPVVGIDLGTTHSLVAVMKGDRPELIPNRYGKRLTPSVVGLDKNGQVHVGESAKNQLVSAPDRTVLEVKRLMGSGQKVQLGDRSYTPQEISGFILKALKEDAERALGEPIVEAVVTVPAYFTDAQRQATKDAGALAGLKVERILNEPTAAALAYGIEHLDKEQFVLVYDLGGGTFDVSVLEMFEGVLDVKASAGNNHLGGSDFDAAISEWLFQAADGLGLDVRNDAKARARLKVAAEAAKIELSSVMETHIAIPFLGLKDGEPKSLEIDLGRETLEKLLGKQLESTLKPIETALKDAKLDKATVAEVILVGGSSRIPLVHQLLTTFFGKAPKGGVHPDEAVALGAAIQAGLKSGAIKSGNSIMIADVAPFTLGVKVAGNAKDQMVSGLFSPIIPRNCKVPVSRTESYYTTYDNQRAVDVEIYQGEDRFVRNNTFLDMYTVDGLMPKPKGEESIDITFTYDINGILNVKTRINSTGKEAALKVDKSGQRMSPLERDEAQKRLDREWKGSGNAPGGAAPKPAATGTVADPLVDKAKQKLGALSGDARAKVEAKLKALEAARASGDKAKASAAEAELTDTLFDLE
ncbi:MAG: Hsp70 family protein [Archangiaceae bacterium]|nr:Hsp70 family protein [Archangiaceae bacterium]